jgi:hypothetical protein
MITARPLSTLAAQELAGSGKRALSAPE